MFDQGNEPQDIFAETEPAKPSGIAPGGSGRPGTAAGIDSGLASGAAAHGPSKLIFAIIAVVVLGGLGAGGYYLFLRPAPASESVQEAAQPKEEAKDVAPTPEPTPEPVVQEEPVVTPDAAESALAPDEAAAPIDTDGDGLDDAREAQLGTDPSSADTDADGLSDREEVVIYMTDPKNPDTDGDSFLDGQEVRGGFDPKGPGRLFTVPGTQP